MRGKEVGLYRRNGTEDEGTLRSKRLTTKEMPRAPTTLMTLVSLLIGVHFSRNESNRHSTGPSKGDDRPM